MPISNLQQHRLYLQSKPLVRSWRRLKRNPTSILSNTENLLQTELINDYIEIDCGGWLFADRNNKCCIAIEMFEQSKNLWSPIHFEYDYLTWHPDYLPNWPVLAYYSTYFKYCGLDDFINFCCLWAQHHHTLIIGLDPTKIKFNYLKYDLKKIIVDSTNLQLRTLVNKYNHLVFVLE